MPRVRKQASFMSSTADDVETAFYEAMQATDLDRMMECWSDDDEAICIHPDGQRLSGLDAIRAAFESLFSAGKPLQVKPQNIIKSHALDSAVHSVVEAVEVPTENGNITAYILATNVYHRTSRGWRMVMHHASAASPNTDVESNQTPQVLH